MGCTQVRAYAWHVGEPEITKEEMVEWDAHVEDCSDCQEWLASANPLAESARELEKCQFDLSSLHHSRQA
jgi:hypothetical protein